MTDPNDDLGEILAPRTGHPSTDLRQKLLRQTESRLVRQSWVRLGVRSGLIIAVFLIGALTGWLARPVPLPEPGNVLEPEVVIVPVVVPVLAPAESESTGTREITRQLSGYQTELQAEQEDDPKSAAKLYKLAGDAFLLEQDYPNASRCYRLFIVRGGDTALSLNPDDSWLLTSLKNAAFLEKAHVQKTDS
ncbi:MAG TPA: hypothetical protein VG097_01980 [Gemmata sp.]|jgi:hypothetical protein|nr:hypothetical protein [Gemmata sp.]